MKQLRIKNMDRSFCLTAGELKSWLGTIQPDQPIVLKCSNKNFRLAEMKTVGGKPVFIGKRGKNDK